MSFLSGPYLWSFAGTTLGVVEDAPTFRFSRESDPIVGDNFGAAIQGVVDRGGNLFVDMILQEVDEAAVSAAWWPYDLTQLGRVSAAGTNSFGKLNLPAPLLAQKILGTGGFVPPAATPELPFMNFKEAVIAPGFDITQLFGSRHRNIPMSFLCTLFVSEVVTNDIVFWDNLPKP